MGKKSEQGNVIELVIIGVLVLVIAGFIAWRFWGSSQASNSSSESSQSASSNSASTATTASTTRYCLPVEKLCADIDSTYKVDYTTSVNAQASSLGVSATDENAVFKDSSGNEIATLKVYFVDGLGGGCDTTKTARIVSVKATSVDVRDTSDYRTTMVNMVSAAIPNNSGGYTALVFLSDEKDYSVAKDIQLCSNTFYADMFGARNSSVTIPNNDPMKDVIKFEYSNGTSYGTIGEAVQRLSDSDYIAAENLLQTATY